MGFTSFFKPVFFFFCGLSLLFLGGRDLLISLLTGRCRESEKRYSWYFWRASVIFLRDAFMELNSNCSMKLKKIFTGQREHSFLYNLFSKSNVRSHTTLFKHSFCATICHSFFTLPCAALLDRHKHFIYFPPFRFEIFYIWCVALLKLL